MKPRRLGAGGLSGFVGGGIAALIGWVIWAFLTYIIGTRLLPEPQTRADVSELMRGCGPNVARSSFRITPTGPNFLGDRKAMLRRFFANWSRRR